MVVTAWVMRELVGDRPYAEGGPLLMRDDSITQYPQSLGAVGREGYFGVFTCDNYLRFKLKGEWNLTGKRIPGVQNTVVVDGISRWHRLNLTD